MEICHDMTVRWGARAGWAIGAGTEAGEAADQRHASPVDFFFWGVPATAASPKACMYTPALLRCAFGLC